MFSTEIGSKNVSLKPAYSAVGFVSSPD